MTVDGWPRVTSRGEGTGRKGAGGGCVGADGRAVAGTGVGRVAGPRPAERERHEARRRAASQALRSLRRSSSEVPPQIPDSWLVARANSRHGSLASQAWQTRLAASICSMAGPVVPTGKKRSGSVCLTGGQIAPVVGVPIDRPVPHECHALPPVPCARGGAQNL